MPARHFNLDQVVCIYGTIPLFEYETGDAIELDFAEDDWGVKQGHHGSVVRFLQPNNVINGKVILMPGSPVNEALQIARDIDVATGFGSGQFYLQDLNSTTLLIAPQSWIQKLPPIKGSTEPGGNEWMFTLAGAQPHHGQNRLA